MTGIREQLKSAYAEIITNYATLQMYDTSKISKIYGQYMVRTEDD